MVAAEKTKANDMQTGAEKPEVDALVSADEKSDATFARYYEIAIGFIHQYVTETGGSDVLRCTYEERSVCAILWFLSADGRWSASYIRLVANALAQWTELLAQSDLIAERQSADLMQALLHQRPRPSSKGTPGGKRRTPAKSCKARDLRRLIEFFRKDADRFKLWIAGYLQIASRIGWRPGELLTAQLDGVRLWAPAEKRSNQRGLCERCELFLNRYPTGLVERMRAWLRERDYWIEHHGGNFGLLGAMNKRIERACRKLGIPPICAYTMRHFAIASMKASGMSLEAIAVVVNHASTRTATERYGKARTGRKRPKKMFSFDPARLELVRTTARTYSKKEALVGSEARHCVPIMPEA